MPRAKKVSDDIYNARRRAKRALAKLNKQISNNSFSSDIMREAAKSYAKQLEKDIKSTYADSKTRKYNKNIMQTVNKINSVSNTIQSKENRKNNNLVRNKIFGAQINAATRKDSISAIDRNEAKLFYRLTQSIWKNSNIQDRNIAIMKALGVDTLEEAFKMLMATDEAIAAKKLAELINNNDYLTSENEDFYNDNDFIDDYSSPVLTKFAEPLTSESIEKLRR